MTAIQPRTADTTTSQIRTDGRMQTAIGVIGIWIATGAIALFAPDLVTGVAQEHIPLPALTTWLWAGVATAYVVLAGSISHRRAHGSPGRLWYPLTLVAVWAVAAVASIYGPELVTGTDPTRVPLIPLLAPVAAAFTTGFLAMFASAGE